MKCSIEIYHEEETDKFQCNGMSVRGNRGVGSKKGGNKATTSSILVANQQITSKTEKPRNCTH